ncbi:MAG: hypothetical protein EOO68_23155 [Moraxellaceae bacterium]|jgi:hypothetical protein|nr:MAG: hypothetical protein EOO68_23155 [Moraxellaceae bacterium]
MPELLDELLDDELLELELLEEELEDELELLEELLEDEPVSPPPQPDIAPATTSVNAIHFIWKCFFFIFITL